MRRGPGTFYFFPVFLPLAELLPWLLALLGAVAGLAGFSFPVFWRQYRRAIITLGVLCIALAVGIFLYTRPAKEVRMEGTRQIAAENFPAAVKLGETQTFRAPQTTTFSELWTVKTPNAILATPLILGDLLVYGTFDNTINALSRQNGAESWSMQLKNPVFSLAKGESGIIYSGEGLHQNTSSSLTAIHAADGAVSWQREFLGHLEETALVDEPHHRVWTSAGPGGLWALDTRTGRVLWHAALGHIDSQPLLHGKTLYVAADTDETNHKSVFFALDAAIGKTLWSLDQPGQPWGSPEIDRTGKMILTTTGLGQIGVTRDTDSGWAQGISLDGKLVWETKLPGMTLQPSAYVPESDLIIHTTKNGYLVALHGADGSLAWQAQISTDLHAPAVLITGFKIPMLASTAYDGTFSIRNALTGDELVRRKIAIGSYASPVAEGDIIYVSGARVITAFGGLHSLVE